jgi:hypothetical protein
MSEAILTTDPLLRTFAQLAQERGVEVSMTLTVSGAVLTGTLVGRDAWSELLVDAGRRAGGEAAEGFTSGIQAAFQETDVAVTGLRLPYDFFHLKDARVVSGAVSLPAEGMLWRGRIDRVSGWSLTPLVDEDVPADVTAEGSGGDAPSTAGPGAAPTGEVPPPAS